MAGSRVILLYSGKVRREWTIPKDVLADMMLQDVYRYYPDDDGTKTHKEVLDWLIGMDIEEFAHHVDAYLVNFLSSSLSGSAVIKQRTYPAIYTEIKNLYPLYISHGKK